MTNTKDFSIVEVQNPHYLRSYIMKAQDVRAEIKEALKSGTLTLLEVNDEGDIIEDPIAVPIADLVGFSVQAETGLTQLFHAGRDPEDDTDDVPDKPMFAFSRNETFTNWTIGKVLRVVSGVEVDKPDYMVFKTAALLTVPNTADNYISANLDWLIEAVADDFDEMFPDALDEEFDDGE